MKTIRRLIKFTKTDAERTPRSSLLAPRRGFTLVELLVVIAIIGILAALITVAAAGALKSARRAQIKTEIDQISQAMQTYVDTNGSYPPNCQGDSETPNIDTNEPIDETTVFSDLKKHVKQAFSSSREPDNLLRALIGLDSVPPTSGINITHPLPGGMTAGEALVFWLGGFSSDPAYPISGEGGPSYSIASGDIGSIPPNQADPIESRKWVYPFDVARLRPRNGNGYFDESTERYLEYEININGEQQTRRINFWQYTPQRMTQPFLYFDTSRHVPGTLSGSNLTATFDPPAATNLSGIELHVHAIKRRSESANATVRIQFATPDKFQILSAGVDDAWGDAEFEKMSVHDVGTNVAADYLLYPDGPFTGDVADTITNFSEGTLEASQP